MRRATYCRLALLACVVLLTTLAPPARQARAAEPLAAAFDWSVPDRFGMDARTMGSGGASPDQVLDYLVTFPQAWETDGITGNPEVNPATWRVDLDASASRGSIARYAWSVDGEAIGEVATPTFSHDFPAEGSYAVTLTVHDAAGGSVSTTVEVVVQDWLIVAIGDSYGSGEGNPEPVSQAWISALVAAQSELQAAQQELGEALEALGEAQIQLDLTHAEVKPALDALNAWDRECPSISRACAQATTRLIAELAKLGFSEAGELITRGFQYVKNQINSLVKVAQASLAAAQAAYDAAAATVASLDEAIDILFEEGAIWQTMPGGRADRAAHRSSLSGQALAALAIERFDRRTSVTFVHVSYSGARIVRENSSGLVDDQIDKVLELVGGREIDAVLVSIGGNDAGFASILTSLATTGAVCDPLRALAMQVCQTDCAAQGLPGPACQAVCTQIAGAFEERCSQEVGSTLPLPQESAEAILAEGLAKLEGDVAGYPRLDLELRTKLPGLLADRVYLTEYPNLVEDDDGSICPSYLTITQEKWRWIGEVMTTDLNAAVRRGAAKHGWNLVDGVFAAFRSHGYCADDHWVVRAEESFVIQGDHMGVAHPNAAGHVMYGQLLTSALTADLYAGGKPRSPGGNTKPHFRRGEVNDDGKVDIADVVSILAYLFLGREEPGCLDAADADDNDQIQVSDAIAALRFLFRGGGALPAPGARECGPDLTGSVDSDLGCAQQDSCR